MSEPCRWLRPTYPTAPFLAPLTRQRVCVHLEVPLAVGLGGEGRQADETHEGALSWNMGPGKGAWPAEDYGTGMCGGPLSSAS